MTNYPISTALFEGQELTLIHKDGERWLTAEQIGKALGYSSARKNVLRVYERNKNEFERDIDIGVVKLTTPSGVQNALVFSLTGCMLLAMFARTPRAVAFRRWAKHQLAQAAAEPRAIAEEALRQRPLWRRILRMRQYRDHKGLPLANAEIARLLGLHVSTLRRHLRRMEALGIIERDAELVRRRLAAQRLNDLRRETSA